MRKLRELDRYRDRAWERGWAGRPGNNLVGCFVIPSEYAKAIGVNDVLRVIAANGEGWDHLSISCGLPRCPLWPEMEQVKRLFFKPDEVAYQLHVAESDHISVHPFCLHIWRPHDQPIPLPPSAFVG